MLDGKEVLVTGGTGFIGGRLVEKLVLEHHAQVRVLVRNFSKASRIARFPIEMIPGDITDEDVLKQAMQGCHLVFHCAYDFAGDARHRRAVSAKGTQNVAEAALEANVARVVHVSTVSVYGTPDGDLDEDCHKAKTGDIYADTKLEAETLMLRYRQDNNLPVAIVQPTIVYGPFSKPWTLGIVDQLKRGPVALPDDSGLCNAVYVDDVVHGMILAAVKNEAIGESFLLSANEPVTWHQFFAAYERILGTESTVPIPIKHSESTPGEPSRSWASSPTWRRWRKVLSSPDVRVALVETPVVNWPYRLAQQFAPDSWAQFRERYLDRARPPAVPTGKLMSGYTDRVIQEPSPSRLALYRAKTHVRIDKAHRVLGYQPAFDLERGMALTAQFIDWYYST